MDFDRVVKIYRIKYFVFFEIDRWEYRKKVIIIANVYVVFCVGYCFEGIMYVNVWFL